MVSWEKCKRGAKVSIANAQELFNNNHSAFNKVLLKRGDRSGAHGNVLWGKHGQVAKLKKLWWSKTAHLCSFCDYYEMF